MASCSSCIAQTYALTATEAKRKYECDKYPYQQELGFRISGMKVWAIIGHTLGAGMTQQRGIA